MSCRVRNGQISDFRESLLERVTIKETHRIVETPKDIIHRLVTFVKSA